MRKFVDQDMNVVREKQHYTSKDGTQYPRNFPKDEIPELQEVEDLGPNPPEGQIVESSTVVKVGDKAVMEYRYAEKPPEPVQEVDDTPTAQEQLNELWDAVDALQKQAGVSMPKKFDTMRRKVKTNLTKELNYETI